MSFVGLERGKGVALLTLQRGKVNAINEAVVEELLGSLEGIKSEQSIDAVVLTGRGKFFSFGLDVPELYPLTRDEFTRFVERFTELYTAIYLYPKPVVAAINGHAIAGGCMLALACDRRIMAVGKGKIGLNEITFGSSVFAGSVEMLRACVGERNAERVLFSGEMFSGDAALELGLVDRVVPADEIQRAALEEACLLAMGDSAAFGAMRRMLRGPIAEAMRSREGESIREFVRIWYSETTRENLKSIEIRKE
jgi:enoyl-CoA hydratase/carnithine racemase